MAAAPWQIYAAAKRHLASGDISLAADSFYLALYGSASNALDLVNLSAIGSVTGEATGVGYTAGRRLLVGVTWGKSGRSAQPSCLPGSWAAFLFISCSRKFRCELQPTSFDRFPSPAFWRLV
jgi:hypothetical protein